MAPPVPIPPKGSGRTGNDLASSLAASFTVGSPIAQQILAHDIAECSDEEELSPSIQSESATGSEDGPVLYRQPNGIAFGCQRPAILPAGTAVEPVLTKAEKKQSRNEERSLLKENHLLPPEDPELGDRGPPGGLTFSTEVPPRPEDEERPRFAVGPSETSPLLPDRAPASPAPDSRCLNERWEAAVAAGKIRTTWQREARTLVVYSRSLIVTFLLQYSVQIASIFAVGRIGKLELGAVSLASMTANITCYAPLQGLTTSLDTLCAQAYGSGHKHLVGLQLQRMTCFLWLIGVPMAFLWFYAADILAHIIPERRSAELAGVYLKITIAGLPGFAAFEAGKRFTQAQGLFHAATYVLVIATPVNILCNYLFVWHFGWGYVGAPIAVVVTQNLYAILLLMYVVFVDGLQCWGGLSKRAFSNWGWYIPFLVGPTHC